MIYYRKGGGRSYELKVNDHTYMENLRIRSVNLDFQAYEKYINIVK